jgi:hypothetical protein
LFECVFVTKERGEKTHFLPIRRLREIISKKMKKGRRSGDEEAEGEEKNILILLNKHSKIVKEWSVAEKKKEEKHNVYYILT